MLEKEVSDVINSLNKLLPKDSDIDARNIEVEIRAIIKTAFNCLLETEQLALYHALSRKFHPDRRSADVYLQTLRSLNLSSLPQQLLIEVWNELKPVIDNKPESPQSYNPFEYTTDVKNRILQSMKEAVTATENQEEELDKMLVINNVLRKNFPDLYQYEHYSSKAQWAAYALSSSVNLILGSALFLKYVSDYLLFARAHAWEVDILSYATEDRYAKDAALLKVMKPTVASLNLFSVDDLSNEEIKEIYDSAILNTEKSQRKFLEDNGIVDAETIQDPEFTLIFQKIYLATHFETFSAQLPKIFEYPIVQENTQKFADIDKSSIDAILNSFSTQDIQDEIVAELYSIFKKVQLNHINELIKQERRTFNGLQHVNFILCALHETWHANVPMTTRLTQGLIIIAILPLIALDLVWDLFSELFDDAIILIKAASTALINTPLYFSNRFFPSAAPMLMIENGPVLEGSYENDVMLERPANIR